MLTGKWSVVNPAGDTSSTVIVIDGGDSAATCDLNVGERHRMLLLYYKAIALVARRSAQNCFAGG
jgi:hypothetical protein